MFVVIERQHDRRQQLAVKRLLGDTPRSLLRQSGALGDLLGLLGDVSSLGLLHRWLQAKARLFLHPIQIGAFNRGQVRADGRRVRRIAVV
jgi:hypothetical protein